MRRLILVLAVASLAPALSMSASAQQALREEYRLNAAETALLDDVKAQCKSVLDPLIAQGRAAGESQANIDNFLGLTIAPTIQGEMSSASGLRAFLAHVDAQSASATGDDRMMIPVYKCVINARLAQHRNGNRPVSQAAAPTVDANSAAAKACVDRHKALQTQSQTWPGDVWERSVRLGQALKSLYTGECAGVPDAAKGIETADFLIRTGAARGGQATAGGSGRGSVTTYDQSGRPMGSASGASAGGGAPAGRSASGGRAMTGATGAPIPDANGCIDIVENKRGEFCGPNSMAVRVKNRCTYKVHMQVCIYETSRNRWECGAGSGGLGADVLNGKCQVRGDFLYAGCTEAAMAGGSRGSCGGDPNKQGYR